MSMLDTRLCMLLKNSREKSLIMLEHSPNRVMFLQASLLRDTVRDAALRKKHRGKTTNRRKGAIDIYKSGEATA